MFGARLDGLCLSAEAFTFRIVALLARSLPRMSLSTEDAPISHDALKEAVADALRENRDWLRELVQEALESCAMDEAQREADAHAAATNRPLALGGVRGHA